VLSPVVEPLVSAVVGADVCEEEVSAEALPGVVVVPVGSVELPVPPVVVSAAAVSNDGHPAVSRQSVTTRLAFNMMVGRVLRDARSCKARGAHAFGARSDCVTTGWFHSPRRGASAGAMSFDLRSTPWRTPVGPPHAATFDADRLAQALLRMSPL
jgi:hypothetical protein